MGCKHRKCSDKTRGWYTYADILRYTHFLAKQTVGGINGGSLVGINGGRRMRCRMTEVKRGCGVVSKSTEAFRTYLCAPSELVVQKGTVHKRGRMSGLMYGGYHRD